MARNTTDTEWQILNVLICSRCNLKTSDAALLQEHHCKPRNQQITADVSYNLVNAKFTCSLCTVELPETKFCEHLEGHLSLKPYVCKYCAKDFPTRDAICEHLRSFHQQDKHIFVLKLSVRTREIIKKAKHHGKEFYKPVNVLVPKNNSAEVVISKTTTQNLTPVSEPKQKQLKSPVSSYSPLSGPGSTTVWNTVPTTISPDSPLSGLRSTTVRNTVPTTISPVSLEANPSVVSQTNSNTVLASARPQLPAEQRRMLVVLTTQPQTGSLPTLSTNVLQTQAPSCLSQNVCPPALATSWRHPFAQKLPGQIIVPYVNRPILLQELQAQRGGIQKPATILPNLVTHSLHSTAPSITQNINTSGVNIVTNVSPASANQVKNAPALTVPPVFHLNQPYLSSPSVQSAPGTQMAATLTSSLVNNISAVTPNTHKAGNHPVPAVYTSHVNQPLAPAVIASTEGNRPLMSADVLVNCQSPTESDAGNIYKVSIQQFPTQVKSGVERDHVNGDFAGNGNLQINQEASSSATEVIHEHSSAAAIKSEESTAGDTDCTNSY